jgi:Zn-dependent protease with chaperone function
MQFCIPGYVVLHEEPQVTPTMRLRIFRATGGHMGFTRRDGVHRFLLILVLAMLMAACSTVPITGRTQLLLVSNAQLAEQYNDVAQAVISRAAGDGTLMLETTSPQSARTLERVRRVAARMLAAADLKDGGSQPVYVIQQPTENAFVTPSGTIVVYGGLLKVADSEAMLAAVIGHEIGHQLGNHMGERFSQRLLAELSIRLAVAGVAATHPRYASLAALGLSLGVQYGVLLPFSREHESEADRIGMTLMARAGYDPNEAVHFWDRMAARSRSRTPEFMSTHPADSTRRDDLQRAVADVMPQFRQARAAPNEDMQTVVLVPIFPNTRQWWKEHNAIIDANAQGAINEDEARRLKRELMRRTVDLSYPGLRNLSPEKDPEFWDEVLRLQEARRAGTIAVWDVEEKIQLLIQERMVVAGARKSN